MLQLSLVADDGDTGQILPNRVREVVLELDAVSLAVGARAT